MNSSKKLAAIVALAISAGLAGTGCMAQPDDADEIKDGQDQAAAPAEQAADVNSEKTGTASEKCGFGGGWGGWGGCGGFGGFGGWGGCGGFGGWGGCGGFGGWGGCGGFGLFGLGWGGFGCGGFGGWGGWGGCGGGCW